MTPDIRALGERILQRLQHPEYQPLDKVDLSKELGLPSSERRVLREALDTLERDGLIARIRKDRYILPDAANLATGILQVHVSGSAHLVNEKREQADIFVSAGNTGTAFNRDKVVVQLIHEGRSQARRGAGDRVEGRVIRILERATDTVVGAYQSTPKRSPWVIPDDARFQHDVTILAGEKPLPRAPQPGDKVVVKLEPWEDRCAAPEGTIIEVLGPATAPGVDMLSIIRKYDLPLEFPAEVMREAERIPEVVDPSESARREDLRDRFVMTIDPDDARDFDDAINVEETAGGWQLGVHIADVSHYVQPGTPLDTEAKKRGNSTYLADRVIPMLPERLSNGVCSLKPGVDRLTFSAFMEFNRTGEVKSVRFARTVIRSAARLSYRQAFAMLQGQREMPPLPPAMDRETRGQATVTSGPPIPVDPKVAEQIATAWKLASLLRKKRFAAGSLDLDFPEVKVWLDGEGRAVRIEKVENDISHQLIEECMLAANEFVAREIKNRLLPGIYRIHEDPDPAKLAEYREVAAIHGFRVGDLTLRSEVQKLLAAIKGAAEEQALKVGFLKSLKRAAYDTQPRGHYGLAKTNYTHFTSPIRRYADLLVHRTLADLVSQPRLGEGESRVRRAQPASMAELGAIAAHISDTERVSADAEKDSVQLKKMEYFQQQLASRRPDEFQAVVLDVRSYGLFIELPSVNLSGLIHVSDLPDDFYVFDPVRLTFTGRKSRQQFKVGDRFGVFVSRIDPRKRQIDFVPAPSGQVKREASAGGRRESSQAPRAESNRHPRRESNQPPRRESNQQPKREGNQPPRREGNQPPKRESNQPARRESSQPPRRESNQPVRRESSQQPKRESGQQPRHESSQQPRRESDQQQRRDGRPQPRREGNPQPKGPSSHLPADDAKPQEARDPRPGAPPRGQQSRRSRRR